MTRTCYKSSRERGGGLELGMGTEKGKMKFGEVQEVE